jgi:hypothetical protein
VALQLCLLIITNVKGYGESNVKHLPPRRDTDGSLHLYLGDGLGYAGWVLFFTYFFLVPWLALTLSSILC